MAYPSVLEYRSGTSRHGFVVEVKRPSEPKRQQLNQARLNGAGNVSVLLISDNKSMNGMFGCGVFGLHLLMDHVLLIIGHDCITQKRAMTRT